MEFALTEAKKALKTDDVPVGAVIVENGKIIARSHNTKEKKNIVTRHAEINVVEKACKKKKNWYLNNCEMYITLEPCDMCMSVIKEARIKKIYYAAERTKDVSRETLKVEQSDYQEQSQKLLKDFFEIRRK